MIIIRYGFNGCIHNLSLVKEIMAVRLSIVMILTTVIFSDATLSEPSMCSLKVFHEETLDPVQGICVHEFGTGDCKHFVESFNRSHLPIDFLLTERDYSVEKPDSITLTSSYTELFNEENDSQDIAPGVIIDWNSPTAPLSRRHIKGYLLIGRENSNTWCRMFKFNTTDKNILGEKLRLQYSVNLKSQTNYEIQVYSMPPPESLEESKRENTFESMDFSAGTYIVDSKNPGNWTPALSASDVGNGTLQVKIGHSPTIFNFTMFQVKLMKNSSDQSNAYRTEVYTQPRESKDYEGILSFNNLETDVYKVSVRPIDQFPRDYNRCLCYTMEETSKYCENICMGVETRLIEVIGVDTALVGDFKNTKSPGIDSSKDTRLGEVTKIPTTDPSTHNMLLTYVGIPSAALVFVSLIIVAFLMLRKRNNQSCFPQLKPKSVFIASTEDNPAHSRFVHKFAKLLKENFICHVSFSPWEDIGHGYHEWRNWCHSSLANANYILLVDSQMVETQLANYRYTGTIRTNLQGNQTDEMFKMMLKNLNPEDQTKLIVVHYRQKCGSSNYFSGHTVIKLPEDISELFCLIHGLRKDTKAFQTCLLPGHGCDLLRELDALQTTPSSLSASRNLADSDLPSISNKSSVGLIEIPEFGTHQYTIHDYNLAISHPNCFRSSFSNEDQSMITDVTSDGSSCFTVAMNPLN